MRLTARQPNFLLIVADDLGILSLLRITDSCRLFGHFSLRRGDRNCRNPASRKRGDSAHSIPHRFCMFSHSVHVAFRHRQSHCWSWPNVRFPVVFTDFRVEFMGPLKGNPGYEGYLNDRVASLSEVMKEENYSTIMSGKWHLGTTKDQC